jgi:hypothetical protein
MGVAVGGWGVGLGGSEVAVGGSGVGLGGSEVAVGGSGVGLGGSEVAVGGSGVAVGGISVGAAATVVAVGLAGTASVSVSAPQPLKARTGTTTNKMNITSRLIFSPPCTDLGVQPGTKAGFLSSVWVRRRLFPLAFIGSDSLHKQNVKRIDTSPVPV